VADAPRRLDACRQAILSCDFESFAGIIEHDSDLMHAVMMTSRPALFYWKPATLAVMEAVRELRKSGTPAAYTIDAGPNVHVICTQENSEKIAEYLKTIPGVLDVLTAKVGGPAKIMP
jgi:diphosphomevalonate decarboxylase